MWTYGFNHEEATTCFARAIQEDAECAMAHWGLAYALGPNYNRAWGAFDDQDLRTTVQRTHEAAATALKFAARASEVERALIEAVQVRYPADEPAEDCSIWNASYAAAMEGVYRNYANDLDVATLYADALMNLTPWELWALTDYGAWPLTPGT
jgi:hypothetical protein